MEAPILLPKARLIILDMCYGCTWYAVNGAWLYFNPRQARIIRQYCLLAKHY